MIQFVRGSIFDSDAQTLVNPVNIIGVSGAGLAKEFKKRFPVAQRRYEERCREAEFFIGRILLWEGGQHSVLFFPTKAHWRDPSELSFIERGLVTFVGSYISLGITSIAFPALGCGNGGLDWAAVKPLMRQYLENINLPVTIYEELAPSTRRTRR